MRRGGVPSPPGSWRRRRPIAAVTDPELKGGGVPLGSRRWCSGPIQQKKRPDLGLACHVEPDRPNSCCCIGQECAVPKITCDVSDRKPAPTCQEKKIWNFFCRVDPNTTRSHRQTPPIAIARSFQLAEKSPFGRRGSVHRPFSSGSVPNAPTSRKRGARFRVLIMYDLKRA